MCKAGGRVVGLELETTMNGDQDGMMAQQCLHFFGPSAFRVIIAGEIAFKHVTILSTVSKSITDV